MIDAPTELLRLADVAQSLPGPRAQTLALRIEAIAKHLEAMRIVAEASQSPAMPAVVLHRDHPEPRRINAS